MAEEKDVSNLFMAHCKVNDGVNVVWLVDSGCSNHMSGMELFKDLDESQKR